VTYVHFEALLGCGRSAFVCRGIQALGGNTSKSEVTRVSKTASKSAVDPKSAARLVLRPARGVLTATLLAAAAFAQNSADPAPSTVVSNSTEIIKHGSIKPEKSAAANDSSDAIAVDPASLLPELPPLPNAKATLIGGTIGRLDRVRDQVTLNIFGGGHATVLFDPRTKVYRGSKEISIADIREGERAYLDTILDGSTVFARAIRLSGASAMGESEGVVLKYRPERGEMTMRDGISPAAVRIRTNGSTRFSQNGRNVSPSTLQAGSLVAVHFSSEGNGHDVAKEVSILALPGTRFTFSGRVLHIDLRSGLLVLKSSVDDKTYEIYMDPSRPPDQNVQAGANVTVVANFEDSRYQAHNITVNPEPK
jgi:hypothetical protein